MWDFMKPPQIKPVCLTKPTHEAIKELEEYRLYIMKHIEACYKKILEELSVTDPDSLATLNQVISEYKEIEASINTKLTMLDEMINSLGQSLVVVPVYDEKNNNLTLRLGEE